MIFVKRIGNYYGDLYKTVILNNDSLMYNLRVIHIIHYVLNVHNFYVNKL